MYGGWSSNGAKTADTRIKTDLDGKFSYKMKKVL